MTLRADTRRIVLLGLGLVALLVTLCGRVLAQSGPPARTPSSTRPAPAKPRLFDPLDLGFFEQPDREAWQKPDQIMDALHIADSDAVAEIGAGGGWFTIRLSRRVGQNGLVFAEDIQSPVLEALKRRVQNQGLTNVEPVLGTAANPGLPEGRLDAALVVGVYHEVEDPVTLLRNVGRALKPRGCLGVVDWAAGSGGPGPDPGERVDPNVVIASASAAGLILNKREDLPPFQYLLVFGRTDSACK